jgi:hypothetical protein
MKKVYGSKSVISGKLVINGNVTGNDELDEYDEEIVQQIGRTFDPLYSRMPPKLKKQIYERTQDMGSMFDDVKLPRKRFGNPLDIQGHDMQAEALQIAKEAESMYKIAADSEQIGVKYDDLQLNMEMVKQCSLDLINLAGELGTRGSLLRIRKERPDVAKVLGMSETPRITPQMIDDFKELKPTVNNGVGISPFRNWNSPYGRGRFNSYRERTRTNSARPSGLYNSWNPPDKQFFLKGEPLRPVGFPKLLTGRLSEEVEVRNEGIEETEGVINGTDPEGSEMESLLPAWRAYIQFEVPLETYLWILGCKVWYYCYLYRRSKGIAIFFKDEEIQRISWNAQADDRIRQTVHGDDSDEDGSGDTVRGITVDKSVPRRAEVKWEIQIGSGYEGSKQVHGEETFQNGGDSDIERPYRERRLRGRIRSDKCVQSCTSTSVNATPIGNMLQGEKLPVLGDAIRTERCPKDIYSSNEEGSKENQRSVEHKSDSVSGRSVTVAPRQGTSKESDPRDLIVSKMAGLVCKSGEESSGTDKSVEILRMELEQLKNGNLNDGRKKNKSIKFVKRSTQKVLCSENGNCEVVSETNWNTKCNEDSVSDSQSLSNEATQSVKQRSKKDGVERHHSTRPISNQGAQNMDIVDQGEQTAIVTQASATTSNNYDGCGALRLGSDTSFNPPGGLWIEYFQASQERQRQYWEWESGSRAQQLQLISQDMEARFNQQQSFLAQ